MKLVLATIAPRRGRAQGPAAELVAEYLARAARYAPTELRNFAAEPALLAFVDQAAGRSRPVLWLADGRGEAVSSEELTAALGRHFDGGVQWLVLGIGPADGWSDAARQRADRTLSFGRITLPHELAAAVAAEQLYRALSLRAGHPYHCGH